MTCELELLGRVAYRGEEVTAPRLRGLLALLAGEHRAGCSVGRLVEGLWGDDAPERPGKAVQVLVARVRGQLGAGVVATTAAGYRLGLREEEVDASALVLRAAEGEARAREGDHAGALAAAEAGLALWDGAVGAAAGEESADPVVALRVERAGVHAALRRTRALALARLGRRGEAAGALGRLAGELPRDEEVLAELLRCEAATAGPAGALARYDRYRRGLRDRLGAEPGAGLRAVHAELLRAEAPAVRHGVAHEPNPLVGRDSDVARVAGLLRTARVVTVAGPGGLGKTRLAHAVAREAEQRVVYVVPLAAVSADADVAGAVASAVGVAEPAGQGGGGIRTLAGGIAAGLGPGPALLVLDNCEQVVSGVAGLVRALVALSRDLRVLATSRAPLGLTSEVLYALPELGEAQAVELFTQRARAARPGVDLPPAEVAALCRQLDGLPLAVELAAARVRALSVPEIARRLQDRFTLLRGGARDAPERHRTLHAVVEWSWNLLDARARRALRALSVFPGGFTAEAAAFVLAEPWETSADPVRRDGAGAAYASPSAPGPAAPGGGPSAGPGGGASASAPGSSGDSPAGPPGHSGGHPTAEPPYRAGGRIVLPDPLDVLDTLEQLADQSLLSAVDAPGGVRFRMLETVREFSAAKRRDAGEDGRVVDGLLAWVRDFGRAEHDVLFGADPLGAWDRVRAEQENAALALTHALDRGDGASIACAGAVLGAIWSTGSSHLRLAALVADIGHPLSHYRPAPEYVEVARTAAVVCTATLFMGFGPPALRPLHTLRRLPPGDPDTLLRALGTVLAALPDMRPPDFAVLTALCGRTERPLLAGVAECVASYVWEYAHEPAAALAAARRAAEHLEPLRHPLMSLVCHARVSELCLRADQGEDAYHHLLAAHAAQQLVGDRSDTMGVRGGIVLACLQRGAVDEAEHWLEQAPAGGGPAEDAGDFYSGNLAARAEIALARGLTEVGLGLWREAVERLRAGAGAPGGADPLLESWALQVQSAAVAAHARLGRTEPVAATAARLRARLAAQLAEPGAGGSPARLPLHGTMLLALGLDALARGDTSGVRYVALSERLGVLREFQPSMSEAGARAAAREADGAAYSGAVAEYAALGRAELLPRALALLTSPATGRG
jgi:predicted ATPase/DNA-binding SARP family transcriptional activator